MKKKIFSKKKFVDLHKNKGDFDTYVIQESLKTWVNEIDGCEVVDGSCAIYDVLDEWCEEIDDNEGEKSIKIERRKSNL